MKKNCAPFARLAGKADAAAGLFDHALGHRQAQARALLLAGIGGIARREGMKQLVGHVRRDALTGIGDAEAHRLAVFGQVQAYIHQAALGEFQRIVGQLEQHLAHPARIGRHARQVGRRAQGQVQALFPGARLQQPRHRARRLQRIAILVLRLVGHRRGSAR